MSTRLLDSQISTILETPKRVGFDEGIGDSTIFRDLEYAFCLQHIKKGYRILDIGSSQPWFLLELIARDCEVTTIDIDPEAMKEQRRYGIDCREASMVNLPFLDDSFDMVLCISTIEHVYDDEDITGMREIHRVSPRAIIILPFGEADNWSPRNRDKERRYDESLLKKRILPGWRVSRRAQIGVWDDYIPGWLFEHCFYLLRDSVGQERGGLGVGD